VNAPLDRADGSETARIREARDAKPQRRAGTPARPATPPAGPAGSTPPPAVHTPRAPLPGAARTSRPAPAPDTLGKPGGTQTPAGGASNADRAPLAGQTGRDAWKAADSGWKAAKRRGRTTPAPKRTGPGMIRKPPPPDVTAARLRDSLQRIIRSYGYGLGDDDFLNDLVAIADHYAATEVAASADKTCG
jgi:hypothetical protein